jgi:hypothetical protein
VKRKKQAFVVFDSETTSRDSLVFDAGYTTITRKGEILGKGSYLFKDVLASHEPFYKQKIASYWEMAWLRKIKPVTFETFRRRFNNHLKRLRKDGMEPIFCAYNAAFDTRVMSLTSHTMLQKRFLTKPIRMLDIWDAWAMSCPKRYKAEISPSGNIRSRAEDVYRYEMNLPTFEESHTGFEDTKIEAAILLKVLARKKKLPIINHPSQFCGDPWRKVQARVKKPEIVLTKEQTKDNFAHGLKLVS